MNASDLIVKNKNSGITVYLIMTSLKKKKNLASQIRHYGTSGYLLTIMGIPISSLMTLRGR